ncbi:Calpain-7-like protein [Heterocephalus glaber]|uniref:Calpain-7-like protein n=1 Tax=Heterocephalus glaber TaxID=10181 RepID=G5AND0_HETGA|nr:Calpain-7-like protein [Heterocephalus glaber]
MTSKHSEKKQVPRKNSEHGYDRPDDPRPFGSHLQSSSIEQKKGKFQIWPEWSESDINAEKWDAGKGGKEKDKAGKSPIFNFFEDPEGKIELPPSLKIYSWKRPQDFVINRGCWRKITVDDFLPFDEDNNLLLPTTTCEFELWPMLLCKAIIKLANVDIHEAQRRELGEFTVIHALTGWLPEVIPLHEGYMDKVWEFLKEVLPEFKLSDEPSFESKIPVIETTLKESGKTEKDSKEGKDAKEVKGLKEFKPEPSVTTLKGSEKSDKVLKDAKDLGKKRNKDGEREKDKDKFKVSRHGSRPSSDVHNSVQSLSDCSSLTQSPYMAVYATFKPLYLYEKNIFTLRNMAGSAEKVREYGLSHICSHPVLVTRSRSCPLVAPPKPPLIPPWKLIRYKKETVITDEPQVTVLKKPEQFLEISSPFLNYRMTPLRVPKRRHNVQSVIKKGLPVESGLLSIAETDETEDFSQSELDHMTGAPSQANIVPQPVPGKEEQAGPRLSDAHQADGLALDKALVSQTTETLDKSQEEFTAVHNGVSKETWLDFEDFYVCFQHIIVFHKPDSYCLTFQKSEFKFSEERVSYYLFVDNLKPIELLVCFSALVRWGESGALTKDSPHVEPGLLTGEAITWKSLKPLSSVLRIHTYATKATMLQLPAGRHMLLFTAYSPVGHSKNCSMVSFVMGDEDVALPHFEQESYRFTEQSLIILKAVGNVIANFKDKAKLPAALKDLQAAHYPIPLHNKELTAQHFRVFHVSLWRLMKKAQLPKLPSSFKFAFRALVLEVESLDSFLEDASLAEWVDIKYSTPTKEEEYPSEKVAAASKIQSVWRGAYVRLLMRARMPGTKENLSVADALQKIWAILELNLEQYALSLLRETFFIPQDMILVPKVYTTLRICVLHVINNDTMEQVPKVFQKVVPYLYTKNKKGYTFVVEAFSGDMYVPASQWKLRLIGQYTPLPFLARDSPCSSFSTKEIRGYYIPNNKKILFRYSVKVALVHPVTIQVRTSKPDAFIKLQVLENEETVVSSIGRGQAIIPAFTFLGNEKPMSSQSNKKVLPYHSPSKKESEMYAKKKSSQGSQKAYKSRRGSGLVDIAMPLLEEEVISVPSIAEENSNTPQQDYKYIIQCLVLYNSWPLTESQLIFVQALKDLEKKDIKVHGEKHEELIIVGSPDSQITSEGQKSSGTSKTIRKGNEKSSEKAKTAQEKQASRFEPQMSIVHTQPEDPNKPYWILRLFSEHNESEFFEVKKDTERADEIRAMKEAWEKNEPGRVIKASQARLRYLSQLFKKPFVAPESVTVSESPAKPAEEGPHSGSPSLLKTSPRLIRKALEFMDLNQYVRKTKDEAVLQTDELKQQQVMEKAEEIHQFQQYRTRVLSSRETDRKEQFNEVLNKYAQIQDSLDEARLKILDIREEYRRKVLEAQHLKLEAQTAQEAEPEKKETEKKVPVPANQKKKKK